MKIWDVVSQFSTRHITSAAAIVMDSLFFLTSQIIKNIYIYSSTVQLQVNLKAQDLISKFWESFMQE